MNPGGARLALPLAGGKKESTKTSAATAALTSSAIAGSRGPAALWATRTMGEPGALA
jgi:hypothetical protein